MPEFTLPKGTILRRKAGIGKATEYTIERVLGQGGFGVTYLASTTITIGNIKQKMLFAIKEFFVQGHCYRDEGDITMRYSPAAKQEVEDCRKEFIIEARRLNEICKDTRHVVDVNEVFEANNTAYYVMEYFSGGSLRDVVSQKREGLPEKRACDFLLPVAEAVAMIHEKHRLLHCDISPDNIMLRRDDDGLVEPVLIDFGESRHFNKSGGLTTKHDSQGCKDGYVPQEQYRGITKFDPRIDVYALSATLYYLVVGRNPKSAWDITPDDIEHTLPAGLSDTLRAAILHGMARDKEARTATVRDFIDEVGAKKTKGQLIPDELPVGFLVGNADTVHSYRVVSEGNKEPFYIHYKAVREDTATGDVSGKTKRGRCDLYEFYDSDTHERQADRTVTAHGDNSAAEQQFVEFCGKKTKGAIDDTFTAGSDFGWHTFDANNTHYLVLTHIRKPLPWEKITKVGSYVLKGVLAAAVLAGVIYLGVIGWNAASGLFSKKSSEPVSAVKGDAHDTQEAQETQDASVDNEEDMNDPALQTAEQAKEEAKRQIDQIVNGDTPQEDLAKKQQEDLLKKQQEAQQKKQQEELAKKQQEQKKQQETNRQCATLYNQASAAYKNYYSTMDAKYLNQALNSINQIGNISQEYAGRSDVRNLKSSIQKSISKQK